MAGLPTAESKNRDEQAHGASSKDTDAIAKLISTHARHHCGEGRIGTDEVLTWSKSPGEPKKNTRSWWLQNDTLAA